MKPSILLRPSVGSYRIRSAYKIQRRLCLIGEVKPSKAAFAQQRSQNLLSPPQSPLLNSLTVWHLVSGSISVLNVPQTFSSAPECPQISSHCSLLPAMSSQQLDSTAFVAKSPSQLPSTPGAPTDRLLSTKPAPCPLPDPNAAPWASQSCEPGAVTSSATDTLKNMSITTMAGPQFEAPLSTAPGTSDAFRWPVAAATSADNEMPVTNATVSTLATTLATMAASTTLGAVSSTFTTLASTAGRAPSTVDPRLDPPCAFSFDLYSCPSEDYLPGTPPVLIALVCIVVAWTFLFAYAVYHLHRCDAIPRSLPAHPQWRQEENHHGQRSPKKAGARFEMRGLGGKEIDKEREILGMFDGNGGREMVKLDSRGADKEETQTGSGRAVVTVSRKSQRMDTGGRLSRGFGWKIPRNVREV